MAYTSLIRAIYNDPQPLRPAARDIQTDQPFPGMWTAIDAQRYDGAEDGDTTMGTGKTESAAIRDLLDRYEDA